MKKKSRHSGWFVYCRKRASISRSASRKAEALLVYLACTGQALDLWETVEQLLRELEGMEP